MHVLTADERLFVGGASETPVIDVVIDFTIDYAADWVRDRLPIYDAPPAPPPENMPMPPHPTPDPGFHIDIDNDGLEITGGSISYEGLFNGQILQDLGQAAMETFVQPIIDFVIMPAWEFVIQPTFEFVNWAWDTVSNFFVDLWNDWFGDDEC